MAEKQTPKATMADLEARGVDVESVAVGQTMTIEQFYPRKFKSGKVGYGGKLRGADGNMYQIAVAVLIER